MRFMHWVMAGAVLTAIGVPFTLYAEAPATRPAPTERRGDPETPGRRMEGRPGPLVERFQQNLAKLQLSDDQQKRIDAVLADAKGQMEEVREGLMSGDEAAREKVGGLMLDVRRQIGEILTSEQRETLRKMMSAPQRGQPGRRRGAGDEIMMGDDMLGGEMREGVRQRPSRDARRPQGPTTTPVSGSGAKVGTPAPAFELMKLDGKPIRPTTLQGRVGVIVFGSYSCPSFRQRAPELESLAKQFGSRVQFLIVYTKEAHPAGEWDVDRNKDAGISVEAHENLDARVAQANKAKDALKLSIPIAPDTMDDAVSAAFGAFPNGAVVLSRDGVIVARQQWVDPHGLETRIEQAMKIPATKPSN